MARLGSIVASAVLAASAVGVIAASPASADPLDSLTCGPPSSSVTTYDPPITTELATTTRTINQSYGVCVGTGNGGGVFSGTHVSSNQTQRSCLQLLSAATVTWTISWNTGETSTVTANRVANVAGAVFTNTFTGVVTDGLFEGHSFVEQMTSPALDITLCTLGLGTVSRLYSTHQLVISPL